VGEEEDLLRAVVARPAEAGQTWLVLADWLDERGRAAEAELIRLLHQSTWQPDLTPEGRQARTISLLIGGLRPCVPRWTNRTGIEFVWCPPGSFVMGSPADEVGRYDDESPPHRVTLTRGFWLAATPVTREQWRMATGESAEDADEPDLPCDRLSHDDCVAFCRRLSEADGRAYRLPTEAEWEYAARAGTTTPSFWGEALSTAVVNFDGSFGNPSGLYRRRPVPVRALPANAWGLYQMHGNVWEWCADWFGPYSRSAKTDPTGPETGDRRLLRGGSWFGSVRHSRSACRESGEPASAGDRYGLRPCLSAV
jgi:uncharacterized protein (TIGR02996 family)